MGKSINKVILVGGLAATRNENTPPAETPFCRFSMATDDNWTDKGL